MRADNPINSTATHSRLFELARTGILRTPARTSDDWKLRIDRYVYPLAAIIFGFSWPLFLLPIAVLLVSLLFVLGISSEEIINSIQGLSALWLFLVFSPLYVLVWLWLWIFEKRHLWTVGFERGGVVRKYLRGLVVGLLLFSGAFLILLTFGAVHLDRSASFEFQPSALISGGLIFFAWMVQGGAEETITRGFLLPILGIRYGALVGIVVSSLTFALLHLFNPGISLIALANLLLFSVFAALFSILEGGLWGIAALHGMWNWAQGNLFGLQVSGVDNTGSSLLTFTSEGPAWLTGGEFGPEGGLVVTLIYIVAIWAIWRLRITRRQASDS